jgi:predicted kinase
MDSRVLVLISGMPGTGKTALARGLVQALRIPVFAKDRIQSALRTRGLAGRATVDGYHLMFDLADEQLGLGLGVVLDAVFPLVEFRLVARDIARRHRACFRPIYCYCSDESVWRERLGGRRQAVPYWTPVGWAEVERLREIYEPWEPETTLFLDALDPVEENLALALGWIQ